MMKWFKHFSTARNDERISMLEDKAGLEGYGFYFKLLEIVGEGMDETSKHEITYSLSRWGRQTNITSKKFLFLLQCCSDVGLITFRRDADNIVVKIPNLLKFRDNYTKNLQATDKQEVEVEVEVEDSSLPSSASEACPHQEIISLYHEHLPMMTQIKSWTNKRSEALRARWREDKRRQNLDFWKRMFEYIAKSDFLTGKNGNWKADLEWIIKSENFVKIMEGKYENRVEDKPKDENWYAKAKREGKVLG